ncbi:MAG: 5-bromo-4-chloroindolyl phosphate hydrolysis family protein [Pseudomonadota bacterium]
MAQRFGGKYSPGAPDTPSEFRGKTRTRVGGRANLLFFVPLPLAVRAFTGDASQLALNLIAFGTLLLTAWLTREGLKAEEAYNARKVAKRPAFPRKIAASLLTGGALFVAGFASSGLGLATIVFAVAGTLLHGFAFGLDPLKDKGVEGIDAYQQSRVARAVDEAEDHLKAMKDAILRAQDRQMESRVDRFANTVRDLARTVEEDPRDLAAARKYLGVYLLGARDATAKFADIYARTRDAQAKADYEALLTDLEQNFAARNKTMLLADRSDLDIEIDVLRERLAREGVRTE